MSREFASDQKQQVRRHASPDKESARERPTGVASRLQAILHLQRLAGNRAVQRLLAQRQGGAEGASASLSTGFELDDETAGRINRARGGGQPLESDLQAQMGEALGYDFGGVRVHTGTESDELNQQLSARAFTTGQDIFVRSGEYDPASSGGRELIAHELSHVVQQGTGRVPAGGSGMNVRPPGDAFEQEADALALQAANAEPAVASAPGGEGVQRQDYEEEELQMMPVAMQPAVVMQPAVATQQDVQRQEDDVLGEQG